MKHTLRLLRIVKILKRFFFYFILTKILFSEDIAYKNFQKYVQSPNGCVFDIKYHQEYFNEKFESSGRFYSDKNFYIYDNQLQCIKYEDGFITTINKINKQVIYDIVNEKDVTIFDILSGKSHNIQIGGSIIEKDGNRIPFYIDEWGIKGSIMTNYDNGSPKKITFYQDKDLNVEIIITAVETSGKIFPPHYDTSGYEVIDLIE